MARTRRWGRVAATGIAVATSLLLSQTSASAAVAPTQSKVTAAVAYATNHHVTSAISVYDRTAHVWYEAGNTERLYGSASVVKVMIAAYMIHSSHWSSSTIRSDAYAMITTSNDTDGSYLWSLCPGGGPGIEPWAESHYGISDLGSANTRAGYWGNTHITSHGMTRLYSALTADTAVWPWLSNAMAHATQTAADGTNQFFGIPQAVPTGFRIKQGWGAHSADNTADAIVNSTGYVSSDRYIVVILSEGQDNNGSTNSQGFNPTEAAVVSQEAKTALN